MKLLFPEPVVLGDRRLCLRPLVISDAQELQKLTMQKAVYRYLPTFLFEKKYADAQEVIRRLYDEGLNDSLILGIFCKERFQDEHLRYEHDWEGHLSEECFCGLLEVYGFRAPIHKASIGYRLLQEQWGKGIASDALRLMVDELLNKRGIEIITASTMVENRASAHVLEKNGFTLVNRAVDEDWGFTQPTPADKWIR